MVYFTLNFNQSASYSFWTPVFISGLSFQKYPTVENAGIQCRRIISYETSENQDLQSIMAVLEQQSICAFFSPSGVKSAMPHFSSAHLKSAKFVAIGETTKQALENYVTGK